MRALSIGLMVLGLMGIALVGVTSPASPVDKVVIGVLDFETGGPLVGGALEYKNALMKELRRNARVKVVDIRESCGLSDLKRNGYEQAEPYKNMYQLDMILHIYLVEHGIGSAYEGFRSHLSLINLYKKKIKETSIDAEQMSIELGFRGVLKKLLPSGDINQVLSEKKEVLAKKEVTVPKEDKKEMIAQERVAREMPPPATSINKVIIGVLDFEAVGTAAEGVKKKKGALMKELRRNTRVELVNIRESCGLSDLKRNGYERAQRYKNMYQLDMILHVYMPDLQFVVRANVYYSLIDLYAKRIKEVVIEITTRIPIELQFRGISRKLLPTGDLNRVLREKKKLLAKQEPTVPKEIRKSPEEIEGKKEVFGKKEVTVSREVKESPEETEGFLIQKGPKLIAEGEYIRVLTLIEDLPGRRRHVQTLECFANLKGWVCDRDTGCKLGWWNLRQRLINSGDNEATPMLLIFLKDEDPYLRLYAAELLGHIGDKRALDALREAGENDESHRVRKYAKKAYEQIWGEKF
jgi:hypothetical protein